MEIPAHVKELYQQYQQLHGRVGLLCIETCDALRDMTAVAMRFDHGLQFHEQRPDPLTKGITIRIACADCDRDWQAAAHAALMEPVK